MPNFNNFGVLSERGSLLYLNYCPAGYETETNMYYPLTYA
ncbi:MAG: hypothetical protein FD169_734 [Bacillota bacterium]|nr:MAG: hypothetical protein FD169_734 [Bacillota bacterium]